MKGTAQGDPLGMTMYALATIPLIQSLARVDTVQVWYADDASAAGALPHLRMWWESLLALGTKYGYFPNAAKTYLVVKEDMLETAAAIFNSTVCFNHEQRQTCSWVSYRIP